MALVLVLSVFNGFEDLVKGMFNSFNPDLKIIPVSGKTFDTADMDLESIGKCEGVVSFTEVLEEICLARYADRQQIVTLKGVGPEYPEMTRLENYMVDGEFILTKRDQAYAIVGAGIYYQLGINSGDRASLMTLYAPRRTAPASAELSSAFLSMAVPPAGAFSIQQEFDDKYVIVPIETARELYEYPQHASSIEVKVRHDASLDEVKSDLQKITGDRYVVKDRFEQQEALFKIMKSEKLVVFLILAFIVLIAVINIISTLTMLILDKKNDIATLHSLGANLRQIRAVFFAEGMLIILVGTLTGFVFGIVLCLLQQQFGIIGLEGSGNFVVNSYPVKMLFSDFLYVFITITLMSAAIVWIPVSKIRESFASINTK